MQSICSHCDYCCKEFRLSVCGLACVAASSLRVSAAQVSGLASFGSRYSVVTLAMRSDQGALGSRQVKITG